MPKTNAAASTARTATLALVAILLAVIVVYGTMLHAPSLIWDDDLNIFENPFYTHGSWTELWGRPFFGMYIPVTSTVWGLLYQLGGGAVWPFRLLNLALHVANVLLVRSLIAGLLRRFDLDARAAVLFGTALFALHPLQTATVSWISGGRDLLATTFALAAVATYFSGRRRRVVEATLLFAAGMLCKPQIAGIPLAIALFVACFDRARLRATLATMAGWSAMVVASAVVTHASQTDGPPPVPLLHRPLLALDALGFYVMKIVWPFPLAADYGRTPIAAWSAVASLSTMTAIAVLAIGALAWATRRDRRFAIGFSWPLLLLPVLGFITFGFQRISTVADHYQYLPLAAIAALVAIIIARARIQLTRNSLIALAAVVAIGGVTSWSRTQIWHDDETFFTDMLAKNPSSFSAKLNIATTRCDRGDWQGGLPLMRDAITSAPNDAAYLANYAYCLFRAQQFNDMIALQTRLRLPEVRSNFDRNPAAATTFANSLGGAYALTDRPLQALAYLCQAEALTPGDADVASNIAAQRAKLGDDGRRINCRGFVPWDVLEKAVNPA